MPHRRFRKSIIEEMYPSVTDNGVLNNNVSNMTRYELLAIIEQAKQENSTELNLSGKGVTELPPEIGQLINLTIDLLLPYKTIS
jgi:hypothetical protein